MAITPAALGEKMKGKIEKIFATYGFVITADGQRYFFHFGTSVTKPEFLKVGDTVEFVLGHDMKTGRIHAQKLKTLPYECCKWSPPPPIPLSVITDQEAVSGSEYVDSRRTPQNNSPNMFCHAPTSCDGGGECCSSGRAVRNLHCGPRCPFQSCAIELQCFGVLVIVPQSMEHYGCLACNLNGQPCFVQFAWRNLKYAVEKVLCDFGVKVRLTASWDYVSATWKASDVLPDAPYQRGVVTSVINGVATVEGMYSSKILYYSLHEFPHQNIRAGTNVEFVSVRADDGEEVITRLVVVSSDVQQVSLEKYIGRVVSVPSGPLGCELGTLEYTVDGKKLLIPFWKKDLAFSHTLLVSDFLQFRLKTDFGSDKNGRFAVDIQFLADMSLATETGRVQAEVLSIYPDYVITVCMSDKCPVLFRKSELVTDIDLQTGMEVDITKDKNDRCNGLRVTKHGSGGSNRSSPREEEHPIRTAVWTLDGQAKSGSESSSPHSVLTTASFPDTKQNNHDAGVNVATRDHANIYDAPRLASSGSCSALSSNVVAVECSSDEAPLRRDSALRDLWASPTEQPVRSDDGQSPNSRGSLSSIESSLKTCDIPAESSHNQAISQTMYDAFGIRNLNWSASLYSSDLISHSFSEKVSLCLSPQKAIISKSLEKARSAWYAVAPVIGAK